VINGSNQRPRPVHIGGESTKPLASERSAHLSIKSKFTINGKNVFCAAKRRIIYGKAKTILDTAAFDVASLTRASLSYRLTGRRCNGLRRCLLHFILTC
jgi:hypothetical protein